MSKKCPNCGNEFTAGNSCAASCSGGCGCAGTCCPRCGYRIIESSTINFFKSLFGKERRR